MRDLINIVAGQINESVGLANRKTGETFINDKGDMLSFVGLNFYPNEGSFSDRDDLDAQVANIEKRLKTQVEFTNQPSSRSLGFGIATFKDNDGVIRLFGRYFNSINSIFTGNFWPNSGLPDGFRLNKASSAKMTAGVMPQDVLTSMEDLLPEDILEQVVAKFGKMHPLTHLANAVSKGQPLPIFVDTSKYPDLQFEAVRDYFCEILQPMAVVNGQTIGNAQEAVDVFFGKSGLKGCKITFGSGKNTGLYDSLLISPAGKQIKISSKGKSGASASVGNLIEAVKDLEIAGNTALRAQYADVIEIVHIVKRDGYDDGPLTLAEKFGMISGKESGMVRALKKDGQAPLTKNLLRMYNERAEGADADKLVPYYNMLAAIAYRVAEHINENTNFSAAAADILNHSALIQVYTTAKQDGTKFVLQQFKSVYPSTVVAGVQFSAHKTYFSSGNKGNFTFKILSNKADADTDPAPVSAAAVDSETDDMIDAVLDGHSSIRPNGAKAGLGREKKAGAPRERR